MRPVAFQVAHQAKLLPEASTQAPHRLPANTQPRQPFQVHPPTRLNRPLHLGIQQLATLHQRPLHQQAGIRQKVHTQPQASIPQQAHILPQAWNLQSAFPRRLHLPPTEFELSANTPHLIPATCHQLQQLNRPLPRKWTLVICQAKVQVQRSHPPCRVKDLAAANFLTLWN